MDLSASTASTSFLHNSLRRPRAAFARPSRRILAPRAAYHDPEGLFNNKPVMEGLIDRNLMKKDMGRNAELAAQMSKIGSEERQTMVYRRQTRTPPDDHGELVEYFLSTVQADMEFEVCRLAAREGGLSAPRCSGFSLPLVAAALAPPQPGAVW